MADSQPGSRGGASAPLEIVANAVLPLARLEPGLLLNGLLSGSPVDQNVISKERQEPIPEGRYRTLAVRQCIGKLTFND